MQFEVFKILSSITTEFTYTAANVAKPSPGEKHAAENVKFSACTSSQILYTRQSTPRSSKYTYTGVIYTVHETGISSSG